MAETPETPDYRLSFLSGADLVQLSTLVGDDWRVLVVGFKEFFPPGFLFLFFSF